MMIVQLTVENVKRIKAAQVTPSGKGLVIVAGRNGQGKSTLLDSIEMALAGSRSLPPEPIRKGARKGEIVVKLGEPGKPQFIVKRTFTGDRSYLSVENAEGDTLKSPQTILDELLGAYTFDPLAFSRLKPKEQRDMLLRLVKLTVDPDEIEAKKAELFERQRDLNREVKGLEAQIASMPEIPATVPDKEVDVKALSEELERVQKHNMDGAELRRRADNAQKALDVAKDAFDRAQRDLEEATRAQAKCQQMLTSFEPKDAENIKAQIAQASEINRQVYAKHNRRIHESSLRGKRNGADELTGQMEDLDESLSGAVAAAEFPVPGLGFSDTGVTYDGLPFEQAADSERLRVSAAIGMALNPKLKVMRIHEGSVLDEGGMKLLAGMADDEGYQVWVERVGTSDGGPSMVVIEDGQVQESAV